MNKADIGQRLAAFKESAGNKCANFNSKMNDVNIRMNPWNYKKVPAPTVSSVTVQRVSSRNERFADEPFIQFSKSGDGGTPPKPKPHEVDPPSPPKAPPEGTGNAPEVTLLGGRKSTRIQRLYTNDPKVFPDEQMLKLGKEAMEEGIRSSRII